MGAGARLVDVVAFIPSLSSLTRGVERLSAVTAEGALGEEFILMEEGENFRGSPAERATFEVIAVHQEFSCSTRRWGSFYQRRVLSLCRNLSKRHSNE